MKKLIFLSGTLESSFVQNELPYMNKYFDEIVVLSYPGDFILFKELSKKYVFKLYIISNKPSFSVLIFNIFHRNIRNEIKALIMNKEPNKIKKFFYIIFYIIFASKTYPIIKKEIDNFEGEIYLYSYWLSRSAFSLSFFSNYSSKIKRIVSRAHRYDLYKEVNPMSYLPFRQAIYNNFDYIFPISNQGKKYLIEDFKRYNENIEKLVTFYLGTPKIIDLKDKYSKNSEFITIASCSSITQVKRLDLIIKYIKKLSKMLSKKIRWIHLGDGDLKCEIEKKANIELNGIVEYKFLGKIPNDKLYSIYSQYQVDLFINLSDSEGIPVSIMEASSMGIPIIARDVGGMSEIVSYKNGILLSKDKEKIYDNVMDVIKIVNNLEKSKNSYKIWENQFYSDKNYHDFYRAILYGGD